MAASTEPRPKRDDPLDLFSPAVGEWFRSAFAAPTPAQAEGWVSIAAGRHTLIHAPTGSGKTLAAFLWTLDRLAREPRVRTPAAPGTVRVLYVSPLKALIYDVERNLRGPLAGIRLEAERRGEPVPQIEVGVRTGDTPADERRHLVRNPPDILITTPESLYLILTSQAAEILRGVEHVIVDEVHALAGTKRGAHLALSLERLEKLTARPPQRIGLSATQRPVATIARFLGGIGPGRAGESREVSIVDAGSRKVLELSVRVPVEDMSKLGELLPPEDQPGGPVTSPEARHSIWPAIHPEILQLIREHHSTIVFCNSRRLAERLANKLNELAGEELVRAHHGSLAREQRVQIEEALKAGRLPAIVATSSLELGIDMGAVDLVIQVESPATVASGLQRIGRAGHQVGEPSKGIIFPKYRGDLLECAVVAARMHEGAIEETKLPRNPLDVLAQQIVAMTVRDTWSADELFDTVRRAAPYESLAREAFEAVLGMLAGAYPSDEFADLKARLVWDREAGRVEGRRDARTVAITSGGTIPDRGLYPVFLVGEAGTSGRRVGELDEEMVYESRVGEVIALGATSWRVEEIKPDRVVVSPAPGQPGKIPFWHGDGLGRPIELGRAMGEFVRRLEGDLAGGKRGRDGAMARLMEHHDLDELAAQNVLGYLAGEQEVAGHLPTDRRIVVERFRDELGDWRIVVLTPFGGRIHAPWAMAIEARLEERLGQGAQTIWSDDGIAIRLPEGEVAAAREGTIREVLFPSAEEVEDLVVGRLGSSAMFAARFRENAARALLLPRRRPGSRTPLWQQRQRSAGLLAVASRYGSFPIIVETYRECLADLFDLPALREVLGGVARREIEVREVETVAASPFAGSLLFDYLAAYMYEGDAPLAERRAGALALDRDLLRELLGQEELRDLIDPAALADLEMALQALVPERAARSADGLHDMLRRLGDLTVEEVAARVVDSPAAREWLGALERSRRAIELRIAGEPRWIAIEDAARYRDALGVALPVGVPTAFLGAVEDALGGLVARWARGHGPFLAPEPARRWAVPAARVAEVLERLEQAGTILRGEFRPGGREREWCDPEVLRQLRRRSLARLRKEVEPVEQVVLARFLPAWQGVRPVAGGASSGLGGGGAAGGAAAGPAPLRHEAALERLAEVVDQLAGVPIPASVLERDVLPVRIAGYQPRLLDELGALGEVAWAGRGSLGRDDGRIVLYRPGRETLLDLAAGEIEPPGTELHGILRQRLRDRGASFYRELASAAGAVAERDVLDALWDLVWAGEVTNDTFAPLRALRWGRPKGERRPRLGRLALGPPEAAGRWSLVERSASGGSTGGAATGANGAAGATATATATATARLHSLSTVLLERHGVLTREAVAAEEVAGGFSAVYPVLRAMEESGRIRRGYFVDGLGAAQFALPGAVDRLRSMREAPGGLDGAGSGTAGSARRTVHLLAAADPANPYGAALAWPRRSDADRRPLPRAAGAYAVLVDGVAGLYLERGGHSLQMLPAADDGELAKAALAALRDLVVGGRMRELVLSRVDGEPVGSSPWRPLLEEAGFVAGYRGYVLRPGARRIVPAGRGLPPETAIEDNYWRNPAATRRPRN